ncbi:NifU family protein [Nocardioides fonticola]|uniref:NifU family protein n=1 Tax=Nocardioides fonticola TaxID=450363 RepID=UPI0031D6E22C
MPVHPEAVPGRPEAVRWVVPAGLLGFVGEPAQLPGPLAALVADGPIARLEVEPAGVLIDLRPEADWAQAGESVRAALQQALAHPEAWYPPRDVASPADERLAAAARQVLAGEVGEYARSHGGALEVVAAHDGVVEVRLEGTCEGCPAAGRTLEERVLVGVRRLDPSVRSVVARRVAPASEPSGRRLLPLWPRVRGA